MQLPCSGHRGAACALNEIAVGHNRALVATLLQEERGLGRVEERDGLWRLRPGALDGDLARALRELAR